MQYFSGKDAREAGECGGRRNKDQELDQVRCTELPIPSAVTQVKKVEGAVAGST